HSMHCARVRVVAGAFAALPHSRGAEQIPAAFSLVIQYEETMRGRISEEHRMRRCSLLIAGLCFLAALAVPAHGQAKKAEKPQVEVVFCLDTTGSMQGLIDAAKAKIWSICNQIAGGQPTPDLKIGLVAYRDRGDEYITKIFDLTDNLDAMYGNLMALR